MDYFYDGQVRRYLAQFIQILSNYAYKDAKGNLVQIPVRYGDTDKMVGQIMKKNSENTIPSAPFISCYIKELHFDRERLQDPTFVGKINVREREFDEDGNRYLNTQGSNYTIERIMPTPYKLNLTADIWTTSNDQKLQIFEQLSVIFNPSFEIQTTDNYIDWTSLSTVLLNDVIWSSRQVPIGAGEDIDIMSFSFETPIWITPPAKVKKLGIITKIIANIFSSNARGTIGSEYDQIGAAEIFENVNPSSQQPITSGDFDLLVINNTARLIRSNGLGDDLDINSPLNSVSWLLILDKYPGKFRAGLSQLRYEHGDGNEVIAGISLNPSDDRIMILNVDPDTVPSNTTILGRGTVDAVINPETFNPGNTESGTRYLILEDININDKFGTPGYKGPDAWKDAVGNDFQAHANDIIEWSSGKWNIVFNSTTENNIIYITNSYTNIQYKWENGAWSKSYEGVYNNKLWRLIL
jgi:hypothetical protein